MIARMPRAALFVAAATGGGIILSTLLKLGFDRPRPDLVPHGSHVYTASFPSGHSTMAAIVYLTLGAMLSRILPTTRLRSYVMAVCILVTLAVGVSRVYLGVHWPTDVLAGWLVGAAWALLWGMILVRMQLAMAVETPGDANSPTKPSI
jgi:undecaprenyl-diphosphatase